MLGGLPKVTGKRFLAVLCYALPLHVTEIPAMNKIIGSAIASSRPPSIDHLSSDCV